MSLTENEKIENPSEILEKRFEAEREEFSEKIGNIIQNSFSGNILNLSEVLTDLYYTRQTMVKYNHSLLEKLIKYKSSIRTKKKQAFDKYTKESQYKITKDERDILIEAALAGNLERFELLSNHLDFLKEAIDTLDKVHFSIKARIEIQKLKTQEY